MKWTVTGIGDRYVPDYLLIIGNPVKAKNGGGPKKDNNNESNKIEIRIKSRKSKPIKADSIAQIAEKLNLPVQSIRNSISKAKKSKRDFFSYKKVRYYFKILS